MIDRRTFAAAAVTGAAALAVPTRLLAGQAGSANPADARLRALLDRHFAEQLRLNPEEATSLGLDTGANAGLRARLSDSAPAGVAARHDLIRRSLTQMRAIGRDTLSARGRIDYDTFFDPWTLQVGAIDRFSYGTWGWPAPYSVSQLTGSYLNVPDFLVSQHPVATRADADAYLARLAAFAANVDAETARSRDEVARGIVPPAFILDRALVQLARATATPPAQVEMVTTLAEKARKAGIAGEWAGQAARIVEARLYPALRRQQAAMTAARARAGSDAGVWRLAEGGDYYRYALEYATTTRMGADEIHRLGQEQIRELSARADTILKAQGLTQGTVAQRMQALAKRPDQLYPDTPAGKAQLIADLNADIVRIRAKLPQLFGRLPKQAVEVRAIPQANEAGAPGGYYQSGALDGSRPGVFYINLRDTAEWPRFALPTLNYHEAIPGHHLQSALAQEAPDLPMLRRNTWYSASGEGWALYAEQLADEMGMYEGNPLGQLGYLQSFLFRAARLVTDTGLHEKRWTREQAIRTMVEATGNPETSMATEVERYCVWPGQATSYKVGQTRWVALREKAKAALGDRFDIRGFHDVTLAAGSMPLTGLERVVDDWIAGQKGQA